MHRINGVVTTNTTTRHDTDYIPVSPMIDGKQVGGASGNAVYENSLQVQRKYNGRIKEMGLNWKIIACGGINSWEKIDERIGRDVVGIQIFTPLIYSGTRLLRELRTYIPRQSR